MTFAIALLRNGESEPYFVKNFGDEPQIVRIGVDPTSDVPLPLSLAHPDSEEEVRWRHCTLIYTGSAFRLDFEGDADVYINGSPAAAISLCDPFVGRKESVDLRLGRPVATRDSLNPVIRLTRSGKTMSWIGRRPAAARSRKPRRASTDLVERIRSNERAQSRLRTTVSLVAALAFFGLLFGLVAVTKPPAPEPFAALGAWRSSIAVLGVSRGGGFEFVPLGTGWLCCGNNPERRIQIVTNRHVRAELARRAQANPDVRVVAFLPGAPAKDGASLKALKPRPVDLTAAVAGWGCGAVPTAPIAVSADTVAPELSGLESPAEPFPPPMEWRCHPLFETFANDYGERGREAANVYDVAVLRLDEAASESVRKEGRPVFAVAPGLTDDSASVAVLGYPTENLPYALNASDPVPRIYAGQVVRKTNPFLGSAASADQGVAVPDLYAVRAESAGGLSGSPIVERSSNGAFEVVGMVMGASFTEASLTSASAGRASVSDVAYGLGGVAIRDVIEETPTPDPELVRSVWSGMARHDARPPLLIATEDFHSRAAQAGCVPDPVAASGSARLTRQIAITDDNDRQGRYRTSIEFAANELVWVLATARADSSSLIGLTAVRKRAGLPDDARTISSLGSARFEGRRGPVPGVLDLSVSGPDNTLIDVSVFRARCGSPT